MMFHALPPVAGLVRVCSAITRRLHGRPEPRQMPSVIPFQHTGDGSMGKGILLWLIGVPIPVILLLWLFFH
jgi:hypothetical protein